jgi:hypothetical protein
MNVGNRNNKRKKFGFSTSEDALTWSVFKFLHQTGQLAKCLAPLLELKHAPSEPNPALLLWGVPIPRDREPLHRAEELSQQLISIADWLFEEPNGRTEPDVLIDLEERGLVIIEVKHNARTATQPPEYAHWSTYYPEGHPIRESLCYELARNWRFGLELAHLLQRPFTLVYLGPDNLFDLDAQLIAGFENCLPPNAFARFQRLPWNDLLASIAAPPDWLVQYVTDHQYVLQGENQ